MNTIVGDDTFTLMIFAVGDVLTLGAMVRGDFDGTASWRVGDRSFAVPLRREDRGRSDVRTTRAGLVGQHGGFDDYDWVNVEVPIGEWWSDGVLVRLDFRGDGVEVALPDRDRWFVGTLVRR
jgi:hypothetical protein